MTVLAPSTNLAGLSRISWWFSMYAIPAWLPSFSHLSKNKASLSAVATCAIPQASKPISFAFSFISEAGSILKHFELIPLFL